MPRTVVGWGRTVEDATATDRRENPAACFEYRDDDQLAAWEALDLVGQTIELETASIDRHPSQ